MSKAVDIFSGILFVRTRHYDDVKKVVVLQGNKPERRFFEERPQGEWGKWIIAEIQCPNCFEYFETDCYSTEELNKCPNCGADMRKPNCVTCDHFGDCEGCEKGEEE